MTPDYYVYPGSWGGQGVRSSVNQSPGISHFPAPFVTSVCLVLLVLLVPRYVLVSLARKYIRFSSSAVVVLVLDCWRVVAPLAGGG